MVVPNSQQQTSLSQLGLSELARDAVTAHTDGGNRAHRIENLIQHGLRGDGHQPNSRGLYSHYKDSLLKVSVVASLTTSIPFSFSWDGSISAGETP